MRMQGGVSLTLNGKAPHQHLTDKVRMIRPSTLALTKVQDRKSTFNSVKGNGAGMQIEESGVYVLTRAQEAKT